MKKMTLNNIHEWPIMTKMLICFLAFAALLYLGYRYDLSNQMQKLSRAAQEESDLKQQIELVIQKSKMIQSEVSHLPELQSELSKWQKQLVSYNDLPEVLNQILKLGGDNHLFFSSFTPGESVKVEISPKEEAPAPDAAAQTAAAPAATTPAPDAAAPKEVVSFQKVPIKVVVVGNYHELADFISQVANMPWIVAVGNFTITNEDQTALLGETLAKQAQTQHLLAAELALDVYHTGSSESK